MKIKFLTKKLFLEFGDNCIELNFLYNITYPEFYRLNRVIFKSIVKFLYLFNETSSIFILIRPTLLVTHRIENLTFNSLNSCLKAINRILIKKYKDLVRFKSNEETEISAFIDNLYSIDPRFLEISARQYNSVLNTRIIKNLSTDGIINSVFDIFQIYFFEISRRWNIQWCNTFFEPTEQQQIS